MKIEQPPISQETLDALAEVQAIEAKRAAREEALAKMPEIDPDDLTDITDPDSTAALIADLKSIPPPPPAEALEQDIDMTEYNQAAE